MSGRRRILVLTALGGAVVAAEGGDAWRDTLREEPPPWYDPAADGWRRIEVRDRERPTASTSGGGGGLGVDLVAVLVIAALAIALFLIIRQILRLLPQAPPAPAPGAAARTAPPPDLSSLPLPDASLPPDEGLRRALEASDWRRAVVWVHARLLLRLDAAGALRLERGSTERTLLAAARSWAGAHPAGAPAARALERTGAAFAAVYFGHAGADRALVDRLLEADRAAERALAATGAA